jgi:hypothetical protein
MGDSQEVGEVDAEVVVRRMCCCWMTSLLYPSQMTGTSDETVAGSGGGCACVVVEYG